MAAIGRSPAGVAMGVSGDAQTGQTDEDTHCHVPFVQVAMSWLHADEGQDIPGVSHRLPLFGVVARHGAVGAGA